MELKENTKSSRCMNASRIDLQLLHHAPIEDAVLLALLVESSGDEVGLAVGHELVKQTDLLEHRNDAHTKGNGRSCMSGW